jgi:hypothetical protein
MPRVLVVHPATDRLDIPKCRSQSGPPSRVKLRRQERRKDEDRLLDPRVAKLFAFFNGGDAESPGIDLEQCMRNTYGTQTVGVGFHHR